MIVARMFISSTSSRLLGRLLRFAPSLISLVVFLPARGASSAVCARLRFFGRSVLCAATRRAGMITLSRLRVFRVRLPSSVASGSVTTTMCASMSVSASVPRRFLSSTKMTDCLNGALCRLMGMLRPFPTLALRTLSQKRT